MPVLVLMSLLLCGSGKLGEAEQLHRQVLEARQCVLGSEHPDTLLSQNDLALVLQEQGKQSTRGAWSFWLHVWRMISVHMMPGGRNIAWLACPCGRHAVHQAAAGVWPKL